MEERQLSELEQCNLVGLARPILAGLRSRLGVQASDQRRYNPSGMKLPSPLTSAIYCNYNKQKYESRIARPTLVLNLVL